MNPIQGHAERILRKSPYRQLHQIRCEVVEHTLFLRGQVTSYHFKQLAQETVRGLAQVQRVYNFVKVKQEANNED